MTDLGSWRDRVNRAVRGARVSGSVRLRVVHLLWEVSPGLAVTLGLFVLADGILPNLAWIALGASTGRIPAAVTDGLGSAAGRALLLSLAVGAAAYGVSLMRTPVQDLLEAHCSAVMSAGMQRRLARAVCAPAGIEHLEDPAVLDRLSAATGELTGTRPADAPVALAGVLGDRLGGLGACVVLATFRWWLGLLSWPPGWPSGRRCAACWPSGPRYPPGHPGAPAQLVLPGLRVAAAVRRGDPGVRPG